MAYDPRNQYPQPWQGQPGQQPQEWRQGGQSYQGQPQYPGPQFYPLVQVTQQAVFPARTVTRRPLGIIETCFHAFMTLATGGLWGFVWWGRVRSRRSYTTFR